MSLLTFLGVLAILGSSLTAHSEARLVKRQEEVVPSVKITKLNSWELPQKYLNEENTEKEVQRFQLKSEKVTMEVMSLDLVMTSIKLPNDNSTMRDVVLGFDGIEGYLENPDFSGVFISLSPEEMKAKSKSLRNWRPSLVEDTRLVFSLIRDDVVMLNAEFNMDEEGKVRLTFTGLLSEPSFLNVALKQYFNLAGHATGISGLNEQIIQVNSAEVTDSPGGEFVDIEGNKLDLRVPKNIGSLISKKNITLGRQFIMDRSLADYDRFVTRISHGISRRFMEVYSNQPSLYFDVFEETSSPGKGDEKYELMGGVEISTNTISEEKELSNVIPGNIYKHVVVYRFGVDEF